MAPAASTVAAGEAAIRERETRGTGDAGPWRRQGEQAPKRLSHGEAIGNSFAEQKHEHGRASPPPGPSRGTRIQRRRCQRPKPSSSALSSRLAGANFRQRPPPSSTPPGEAKPGIGQTEAPAGCWPGPNWTRQLQQRQETAARGEGRPDHQGRAPSTKLARCRPPRRCRGVGGRGWPAAGISSVVPTPTRVLICSRLAPRRADR